MRIDLSPFKCLDEISSPAVRDWVEGSELTNHPYMLICDGEEVGYIGLKYGAGFERLILYEIFVLPDKRQCRIGTRAMGEIERVALQEGLTEIVLLPRPLRLKPGGPESNRALVRLIRWYESLGYTRNGQHMIKYLTPRSN